MPRTARFGLGLVLGLLFALAIWLRVTSLEALPDIDADEAWFATQFVHILRGEPFEDRTPTGNPLSPFQAPIEVPLLLAFKPSLWITRVPSVVAGILAAILSYILGSRILDRPTALIAAGVMAVLPFAIVQSRTGYDCSQTPLYSVLLLYFAFRTNLIALIITFIIVYFVHPTNVFILPLLLMVYVVRSMEQQPEAGAKRWPMVLMKAAALGALGLGLGLLTLRRPLTQGIFTFYRVGPLGRHELIPFWTHFGRMFLATGRVPRPVHDALFWAILLPVFGCGSVRLVSNRQWDRLALVAGVILSALGLFTVGGSDIIQPGMSRWGLFLLVPSAFAFACLLRELRVAPGPGWRAVARPAQVAFLVVAGWVTISTCQLERLTLTRVFDGTPSGTKLETRGSKARPLLIRASGQEPGGDADGEAIWTFQTDVKDAKKRALSLIERDLDRRLNRENSQSMTQAQTARKTVIITEDWWIFYSLRYLALPRRDFEVLNYERLGQGPDERHARLRELLEAGAYVVGYVGKDVETTVKGGFPGENLQRFDVPRYEFDYLSIYRLKDTSGARIAADEAAPPAISLSGDRNAPATVRR
jgi:hypothetical protein